MEIVSFVYDAPDTASEILKFKKTNGMDNVQKL